MAAAIDWTPVEEATAQKSVPGFQIALIESAKILEQRLQEEKVAGKTLSERIAVARLHLTRPDDVTAAAEYVESLRTGHTKALTEAKAKRYLQSFRQAVADLNDLAQARDSWQAQAKLYIGLIKGKQRWVLRIVAGIAAFFVLVLILADTSPGQFLIAGIVAIVEGFFKWVIIMVIVAALLLAAVLGTAMYLDKERGGRIKDELDDV